jgi:hypothetical protein
MQIAAMLTKEGKVQDMRLPFLFKWARRPEPESRGHMQHRVRREQSQVVPAGARVRTQEEVAAALANPVNPFDKARAELMAQTGASSPLEALLELDRRREEARKEGADG